eukprot:3331288-Amphidinium_carterae.1
MADTYGYRAALPKSLQGPVGSRLCQKPADVHTVQVKYFGAKLIPRLGLTSELLHEVLQRLGGDVQLVLDAHGMLSLVLTSAAQPEA